MTTTLGDLRQALRLFRRTPATTLAAIVSLALGIGANTAIFSVLHAVVLNPLPYPRADQLVVVWETGLENPERWVAPANFVDWTRETTSFAALAAFDEFRPTLTGQSEPEVVRALGASGTFFEILGAQAAQGRALMPRDDTAGAEAVAVLSHGFWERAFGGAADVMGRTVTLDGRPHTVVGIMPAGFESPLQSSPIDVWVNGDRGVPLTFPFRGDATAVRDSHLLYVIGRLAPGVTRAAAQRELDGVMQALSQRYPDTNAGLGVNIRTLHEQVVGRVRGLVLLLQTAGALMLLIACANVAHLLLARAASRHGEMTTRLALGAPRSRLVRQMLAEALAIAGPGGVLGVALAYAGIVALVAARPEGLPRVQEIELDSAILAFTAATTLLTVALFGLGPAAYLMRYSGTLQPHLTTRTIGARTVRRWHRALVVAELALAQVLLVGAGLLLASFMAAQRVPLGFATTGRVAADLTLSSQRYLAPVTADGRYDATAKQQFVDRVLEQLQGAAGVRAAAASFTSPLTGAPNRGITVEGRPPQDPGRRDTADFQVVTPDFFRTTGATLVRGRALSAADTAASPRVALVNQAFVEKYFAGRDAIGRRVRFGADREHEIVGIVADMRYRSLEAAADPTFYLPLTQNDERWPFLSFTVWSDADDAAAVARLRAAIRTADPDQAVIRVRGYDEVVSTALAPRRFNTTLVIVFAGAAVLLAAVGIYGVMSYAVAVRTRELGVRAALGAAPRDLSRLVLREGAWLTAAAVAAGIIAGLLSARGLGALLYDVSPHDTRTYLAVALTLVAVAMTATWLPARRAVQADPMQALREG